MDPVTYMLIITAMIVGVVITYMIMDSNRRRENKAREKAMEISANCATPIAILSIHGRMAVYMHGKELHISPGAIHALTPKNGHLSWEIRGVDY